MKGGGGIDCYTQSLFHIKINTYTVLGTLSVYLLHLPSSLLIYLTNLTTI